jgi:hypothetical protein
MYPKVRLRRQNKTYKMMSFVILGPKIVSRNFIRRFKTHSYGTNSVVLFVMVFISGFSIKFNISALLVYYRILNM